MKSNCNRMFFRHSVSLALIVFLLAVFIGFWGTAVYAATYSVGNTNDSGSGSLRQAIIDANGNSGMDEIALNVTGTITLSSQLEISSDMIIQGPGPDQLFISGNDACRVFYIPTTVSVDISGISIVSGDAGSDEDSWGGGIYNLSDNLTVNNCHFIGNTAYSGGGMCNYQSSPTLINCTLSGNSGQRDGAGMLNRASSPTLINCTFSENSGSIYGGGMCNDGGSHPIVTNCNFYSNSASIGGGICNWYLSSSPFINCTFSSNTASSGGGMYNFESPSELTSCDFSLNTATNHGGGMYNSGSDPVLTSCDFTSNSATNGGGFANDNESNPILMECNFIDNVASSFGGAMWISNFTGDNSRPVISGCTLSGNTAAQGGGIRSYSSSPEVNNSTFSLNSANYGGGMYNSTSSPDIANCTFNGNGANVDGGGMYNSNSDPIVTNCTLSGNSAPNEGGGIYNSDSSPTVTNCIFWNGAGGEIYNNSGSTPTLGFAIVQSDDVGEGTIFNDIISADPILGTLADNGGPTWTCALGRGSSAIDEGTDSGNIPNTDQRGIERPQGAGYDIGAFEVEQASSSGGGCSISTIPAIGLFLLMPLMFLSRRRK